MHLYFHWPTADCTSTLHLHVTLNRELAPLEAARSYLLSEVIDWLRAGPDRDIPGLLRARQAAEPGLVSDDRSDTIDEWVALNEHMCVVEEGVLSPDGKVFRVGA